MKDMCLAFPGKIIKLEGQQATTDFNGVQKSINVSLVEIKEGDYVIVHAGFAIQKLSNEDAWMVLKEYEKAERIYEGTVGKDK